MLRHDIEPRWMAEGTFAGIGTKVLTPYGRGHIQAHVADADAIRHVVRLENGDTVHARQYALAA